MKRIDVPFDVERGIDGKSIERRPARRRERSAPVPPDLKDPMQVERGKLSRDSPVAKAMDRMVGRPPPA